jgi:hypothetical protein
MAKPTLSVFTGTESLGLIYNEQVQLNVKFIESGVPFTNSTGQLSFAWLGKKKIILLQGAIDGSGFSGATQDAKLKAFVVAMYNWANQNTMDVKIYTNSFGDMANVHCIDFTYNRSFKDPNRLIYSILMKEVADV